MTRVHSRTLTHAYAGRWRITSQPEIGCDRCGRRNLPGVAFHASRRTEKNSSILILKKSLSASCRLLAGAHSCLCVSLDHKILLINQLVLRPSIIRCREIQKHPLQIPMATTHTSANQELFRLTTCPAQKKRKIPTHVEISPLAAAKLNMASQNTHTNTASGHQQ